MITEKDKRKLEVIIEELKTKELPMPRKVTQALESDVNDPDKAFIWSFHYNTFENYKGFLLIRVFAFSGLAHKEQNATPLMEIMRLIPGTETRLVRNFILMGIGGYKIVWSPNGSKSWKWHKSMWNVWRKEGRWFAQGQWDRPLCNVEDISKICKRYQYCGLLANSKHDKRSAYSADDLWGLLSLYEEHPCVEFLNKFNLTYLGYYKRAITRLEKGDKAFRKFLINNQKLLNEYKVEYNLITAAVAGRIDLPTELLFKRKKEGLERYLHTDYKDYLLSCQELNLTEDQIDWTPSDLKAAHDLNNSKIKIKKDVAKNKALKKAFNKLAKKISLETKT